MKVWSWGANNGGQLGLGFNSEQIPRPFEINIPRVFGDLCQNLLTIAGGGCHTLILGQNTISNENQSTVLVLTRLGLLGNDKSGNQASNKQFKFDQTCMTSSDMEQQIACGWDFNIFLDGCGNLHTSGDNSFGQLGTATNSKLSYAFNEVIVKDKFICIAAGMRHAAGIGNSGLYTWGDNSKGQLGINSTSKIITKPTRTTIVNLDSAKLRLVRCSKYTTIVLTETGEFYVSGLNKFGIFGLKGFIDGVTIPKFTKLEFPVLDSGIKDFQCGWNHVLVLLEDGRILSWGRNNFGQLGRRTSGSYECTPYFVENLPESIVSIRCGTEHNLALGKSGKIYSWGWNEHDNCGVKGTSLDEQYVPFPTIVAMPETEEVILIGCGAGTGFAVTKPIQSV